MAATSSTTAIKVKRCVSFGHVDVYEFPCTIGDNPGLSLGGAPIALAAHHESYQRIAEIGEDNKIVSCRDMLEALQLSGKERKQRLLDRGYSLTQIQQAAVGVLRAQELRRESSLDFDLLPKKDGSGKRFQFFRAFRQKGGGNKKKITPQRVKDSTSRTKPVRGSPRMLGLQ